MGNSRLVYSTESGKMCSSCEKAALECICKKKKANKQLSPYPDDGIVRIRRETKGRKGKTVTAIFDVLLDDKNLQRLCTGGRVASDEMSALEDTEPHRISPAWENGDVHK